MEHCVTVCVLKRGSEFQASTVQQFERLSAPGLALKCHSDRRVPRRILQIKKKKMVKVIRRVIINFTITPRARVFYQPIANKATSHHDMLNKCSLCKIGSYLVKKTQLISNRKEKEKRRKQ